MAQPSIEFETREKRQTLLRTFFFQSTLLENEYIGKNLNLIIIKMNELE